MIRKLEKDLLDTVKAERPKEVDSRFQTWAKDVEAVDCQNPTGYAFKGTFVGSGTVEIEAEPKVFLVKTAAGSMRYHYNYYHVIVMDSEGNLKLTSIHTDGKTKGWALRIRDEVAKLVEEVKGAERTPERPEWFPEDVWSRLNSITQKAVAKATKED